MFLEIEKKNQENIALIDSEGNQVSYGDIVKFVPSFYSAVNKRTLIFVLNDNSVGAALGYLGAMSNHIVPLMLGASMDKELLGELIRIYQPEYIWKLQVPRCGRKATGY